MRYLAAYLLAQMGGTSRPQESDIKNILSSVGVECESERVKKLIQDMHGKNINELMAEGRAKMSSLSFGAAPAAAAPAGGAPAAAAPEAAKSADKPTPAKEEKKEESEESDADMGFGLFD
nr:60S acidic ribosomal protein P2 [Hymenolepis microstoma]